MTPPDNTRKEQEFLIHSPVLEKLKPAFVQAASIIRQVVKEGRPIILKHHADCDGYIGAIAMERAIVHILTQRNRDAGWRYLRRMPIKSPYYDYVDAIKDLTTYDRDLKARNFPLIIIIDTGSSEEDLLALKKVKQYGLHVIIVDHHDPYLVAGISPVAAEADILINPHLAGGTSDICAGMLAAELARFVSEDWASTASDHLPGIAGTGDKSAGAEFDAYLRLAKAKGYDDKLLLDVAKCVDFDAFHIGYLESDIIEDLLSTPVARQAERISFIIGEMEARERRTVETFRHFAVSEKIKDFSLVTVKINELVNFGTYPAQGKSVGLFFDSLKPAKAFVMGISPGSITIRANLEGYSLTVMLSEMKGALPFAQLEGGGHSLAGTIRFIDSAEPDVLAFIRGYLKRLP